MPSGILTPSAPRWQPPRPRAAALPPPRSCSRLRRQPALPLRLPLREPAPRRPAFVLGRGQLAFADAHSPYDYDAMRAHGGEVGRHVFPFLYPPPSLLALYPLKLITWPAAAMLVVAANLLLALACIGLVLVLLRRRGDSLRSPCSECSWARPAHRASRRQHAGARSVEPLVLFLLCSTWLACETTGSARRGRCLRRDPDQAGARDLSALPGCAAVVARARRLPGDARRRRGRDSRAAPERTVAPWLFEVRPSLGYGRQPLHLFSPACRRTRV